MNSEHLQNFCERSDVPSCRTVRPQTFVRKTQDVLRLGKGCALLPSHPWFVPFSVLGFSEAEVQHGRRDEGEERRGGRPEQVEHSVEARHRLGHEQRRQHDARPQHAPLQVEACAQQILL